MSSQGDCQRLALAPHPVPQGNLRAWVLLVKEVRRLNGVSADPKQERLMGPGSRH
jgi:hypothetical protein